jgi:maltose alpha-D-glucosyltransferase/alpha-amylase
VLRSLRGGESRVLQAEQSNSSLVFSDRAFVKFFRKLQVGPNPDVELVRFLTVKAGFAHVPAYLGSLSYRWQTGETAVLAVAQEFVPARSDGWSYVRSLLDRVIDEGHSGAATVESVAFAEGLGTVTADMHLALSSDPWSAQFAPEIITPEDVAQWKADYLRVLETVIRGLNDKRSELDTFTGELVSAFLAISRGLEARAQGLDRLVGRSKIRVHGDYHLGQTLRTAAGKLVVLDFEGEPQRSLAERREKKSPLKDVAGMLRSFSYSRGAAANTLNPGQAQESATLVAWERKMKAAFLASYTAVAEQHGARFIPLSQSDLQEAVAAWELDKAVYEVLYELNNRPSWLWIPLTGMLKLGEP